jgi:hypothetical protein
MVVESKQRSRLSVIQNENLEECVEVKSEFTLTLQTVVESNFLSTALQFPEGVLLMDVSEDSPKCPSNKRNM